MKAVLLDTNIVSRILRRERATVQGLRAVIKSNRQTLLSPMVDYEIRRGLQRRNATTLFERYEGLLPCLLYQDLTAADWQQAADLWVFTRTVGTPLPDADILIAAQAMALGAVLVTDNTRHYELFRPLGLELENWKTD